jgi:two-component system sensor histidine kinase GlrK
MPGAPPPSCAVCHPAPGAHPPGGGRASATPGRVRESRHAAAIFAKCTKSLTVLQLFYLTFSFFGPILKPVYEKKHGIVSKSIHLSSLRLSLYGKILLGFGAFLFIMVLAIITVIQLSPYTKKPPELMILPLAEELQEVLVTEHPTALKYCETGQRNDSMMLSLVFDRIDTHIATLRTLVDTSQRKSLDLLQLLHDRYKARARSTIDSMKADHGFSGKASLLRQKPLVDSLVTTFQAFMEGHLPSLGKSLKQLLKSAEDAQTGGLIILLLVTFLGGYLALLIARALTKPILALKGGTQKVGEGKYETVPITTRDEIADLTRAFNLMSDKLRQLDEMRMQMMSEISHEMRTPLQVIKAGCYTIIHAKDGPVLTDRQKDAVGKIHQATNRINQFINSFLDVAKMEAGLMKFDFEEVDIVEMLTPLLQEMQLIGMTRQINVELKQEPVPRLKIDKERMGQVFSNLLSNALKYTPDGGSITIRIRNVAGATAAQGGSKGWVNIDVEDSGVGIPEGDIANLFKKFYQAKNTPLVNEKGSGLGLALVKHVTEAHGGRVSVKSQVGVGSTFTVQLPG